jgi:hypothetical protein
MIILRGSLKSAFFMIVHTKIKSYLVNIDRSISHAFLNIRKVTYTSYRKILLSLFLAYIIIHEHSEKQRPWIAITIKSFAWLNICLL